MKLNTRDYALCIKVRHGEAARRELEIGGQRSEDGWFKIPNIEQQNKEPQNDEVVTSIFDIPCWIFCGSECRQLR